jgi:hypothetical protein
MVGFDIGSVRAHLEHMLELDKGPDPTALPLSLPFAVGVSLLAGCGSGDVPTTPTTECAQKTCAEACADGIDNDRDGTVDCADADCTSVPNCMAVAYGVPYETDCGNGTDDDTDGAIDCADSDCQSAPNCMQADYAMPLESDCGNGLDDDADGAIDCADSDCAAAAYCQGVAYGEPLAETDCSDGLDDDGDGVIDCADSDCVADPSCVAGARYAAPSP